MTLLKGFKLLLSLMLSRLNSPKSSIPSYLNNYSLNYLKML